MFERFTERARTALATSQHEALARNDAFIDTEHLLLGLVRGDGIATKALESLGISESAVRAKVAELRPPPAAGARKGKVPFTAASKKVLECALREALQLGHNYIGTEHLLLALIESDGVAARALTGLGANLERVRTRVLEMLTGTASAAPSFSPAMDAIIRKLTDVASGVPITTADVLGAIVDDEESHAAKALRTLGLGAERVRDALQATATEPSSDQPQTVEIRVGESVTVISDPEVAAMLARLSEDEIRAALKRFGSEPT